MRRFLLAALFASALPAAAFADELPAALVGTWASADSEFNGEQLAGGNALYLAANGRGALVGAPLPVQHCADDASKICAPHVGVPVSAHFEAGPAVLTLTLPGSAQGSGGAKNAPPARTVSATYQAGAEAAIILNTPAGPLRLLHHNATVPSELATMLARPIP